MRGKTRFGRPVPSGLRALIKSHGGGNGGVSIHYNRKGQKRINDSLGGREM